MKTKFIYLVVGIFFLTAGRSFSANIEILALSSNQEYVQHIPTIKRKKQRNKNKTRLNKGRKQMGPSKRNKTHRRKDRGDKAPRSW
jgi:hypothetical protein